jgi:hypothetical protein
MIRPRTSRWLRVAGLLLCVPALIVVSMGTIRLETIDGFPWAGAIVVLALHALARRYPLRLVARDRTAEFTTAPLFAFALLLTEPSSLAVLGLAATAALVPPRDVAPPRWIRPVIEVSRTLLVYGVGAWALAALPVGLPSPLSSLVATDGSWQLLLVVVPAGVLAYAVDLYVGIGLAAIEHGTPPFAVWRQDRAPI